MRVLLIIALGLTLSACNIIYKLPTRQGNVIEQKQLDQLRNGMTRDQVTYLLGSPIAASSMRPDRWDYVGYYKSPRGVTASRIVSLFFTDDKVSSMEGIAAPDLASTNTPDGKAIRESARKDQLEAERALEDTTSGVSISQPTINP